MLQGSSEDIPCSDKHTARERITGAKELPPSHPLLDCDQDILFLQVEWHDFV